MSRVSILRQSDPSPIDDIAVAERMVPSSDPDIMLYVRNKHPAGMTSFAGERTVLFVHGSTYPAHATFDLRLDGVSWMDYVARRGFDVYLLDVRGYGKSTRPPEMDDPPESNPPLVRNEAAISDVAAVVDDIIASRGVRCLSLIGWSWGTTLMASFACRFPDKVERLILYGPQWIRNTPSLAGGGRGPLGAYRKARRDHAYARWTAGVPEDRKAEVIPAGWFDALADTVWASDPAAATAAPPFIHVPNGTLRETEEYWAAGKPYYDAAQVLAPNLVVQGEWDQETPRYMAQGLFDALVNARPKRYVCLGEGTHSIALERHRLSLFRTVQDFLEGA